MDFQYVNMVLVYLRNFSAVVALAFLLIAMVRIHSWLGNRGTRRLRHFMWGAAAYHVATIFITGGQLTAQLPVNSDLLVTVTYAAAHVFQAAMTVLFSLYVLGIINGDPHDHTQPERRAKGNDDVFSEGTTTVSGSTTVSNTATVSTTGPLQTE